MSFKMRRVKIEVEYEEEGKVITRQLLDSEQVVSVGQQRNLLLIDGNVKSDGTLTYSVTVKET